MKTSGVFTTAKRVIKVPKSGVVTLVPWGDVHFGAPLHAEGSFDEWLYRCKYYENPYYFGMGDYLDIGSTSERKILSSHDLHDATRIKIENAVVGDADGIIEKIQFMGDRILTMLEGNHAADLQGGASTADKYICEQLGAKWGGVTAMFRMILDSSGVRVPVTIAAHHGTGGGATASASLNAVKKMQLNMEADIYIQGHDHRKFIVPESRLYLTDNMVLKHKTVLFVRSGSFLGAYRENTASYIADIGRGPAELGAVAIELRIKRSKSGGKKRTTRVEMKGII